MNNVNSISKKNKQKKHIKLYLVLINILCINEGTYVDNTIPCNIIISLTNIYKYI